MNNDTYNSKLSVGSDEPQSIFQKLDSSQHTFMATEEEDQDNEFGGKKLSHERPKSFVASEGAPVTLPSVSSCVVDG